MNRIQASSLAINSRGILVKYSYGTRVIVGNQPCGAGDGIIVRTGLSGDGGDLTHRAHTALGSAGWLCVSVGGDCKISPLIDYSLWAGTFLSNELST
jgi:hypothetical protein